MGIRCVLQNLIFNIIFAITFLKGKFYCKILENFHPLDFAMIVKYLAHRAAGTGHAGSSGNDEIFDNI